MPFFTKNTLFTNFLASLPTLTYAFIQSKFFSFLQSIILYFHSQNYNLENFSYFYPDHNLGQNYNN